MNNGTREFEIKVELTPEQAQRIRKAEGLDSLSVHRWQTRQLVSIYFGTPDHRLRARNTSLRVRRVGGRWVQTAKTGTGVEAGLSNPVEWESEVRQAAPDLSSIGDKALRSRIRKALRGAQLVSGLRDARPEVDAAAEGTRRKRD